MNLFSNNTIASRDEKVGRRARRTGSGKGKKRECEEELWERRENCKSDIPCDRTRREDNSTVRLQNRAQFGLTPSFKVCYDEQISLSLKRENNREREIYAVKSDKSRVDNIKQEVKSTTTNHNYFFDFSLYSSDIIHVNTMFTLENLYLFIL